MWLKDVALPRPFMINERTSKKRNERIIKMSNPRKPFGNFRVRSAFMIISINKNAANINGSEIVPVNANAETNGIVKI